MFEALIDSFKRLKLSISKLFGGLNQTEKKELADLDKRKEQREQRKKEADAEEAKTDKDKTKIQSGELKAQKQNLQSIETTNKKLDKERQKNVDYNVTDPVALLGQELKAQQSSLAGAEGTKKQIENERMQEKAKADKAKEESKPDSTKSAEAQVETVSSTGGGNQKTDTELLAALNTKLDALLRVAGAQLQVQRSLGNDLFAG